MKFENKKKRDRDDKMYKALFGFFAFFAVAMLLLLTFFIVYEGMKPFVGGDVNFFAFLFGNEWNPLQDKYGIGYMIIGTLLSVLLAIIFAVPISIATAVAIVEILPKRIANILQTIVELLAGIPSVIYGIFGLGFVVPLINEIPFNDNPEGNSLLAVGIVLTMMIIPTIIAVSVSALNAVDESYKEASYGLGATREQTIVKVIVPGAKSGILAAIVLGVGRAIGETMAVILVAGNVSGGIPGSIFDKIRPLTANIAMDMSYAQDVHREVLFSTGLVLFIFVFILNIILQRIIKGGKNAKI